MKPFFLLILFIWSFQLFAQDVFYSEERHIMTVSENADYFTQEVYLRGEMPANTSQKISFSFGELDEIENFGAEYFSLNNKKREVKKKDFVLSSVPTGSFYGGWQKYSFMLPSQNSSYTFAYNYTKKTSDLMFLSALWFYGFEKKNLIHYEVNVPTGYILDTQVPATQEGGDQMRIDSQKTSIGTKYTFQSAQKDREGKEEIDAFCVRLLVRPEHTSANAYFNDWYKNLVKPHATLNAQTKKAIDEAIEGRTTRQQKIEALYTMVQNRITYIDFENGIGAVQPRDVNEIFLKKQGDCKDMSNLLCSALQYVGIEANMAVSSTLSHQTDFDFTCLSSANHCICVVPEGDDFIYLDATESEGIFGYPSRHTQGRNIFVVNNQDGKIVRVPKVSSNKNTVSYNLNLQQNGIDLAGQADISYAGMSQLPLRRINNYYKQNTRRDVLKGFYTEQAKGLNFEDIKLEFRADTTEAQSTVNAKRVFTDLGEKYYLSLNFLPIPYNQVQHLDSLKSINYVTTLQNITIDIELEKEGHIKEIQQKEINKKSISFSYKIQQIAPNKIQISYSYRNENLIMEGDVLEAYREINALIQQLTAKNLVIIKPT